MTNSQVDGRCVECMARTYNRLMNRFQLSEHKRQLFNSVYSRITDRSRGKLMPEIHRDLHREFMKISGIDDPYEEEKRISNELALDLYQQWQPKVLYSGNSFQMAIRLSIAGNIMDYGANSEFDIKATISKVMQTPFSVDHSAQLKEKLATATKVLFLGDNAGEIVFDKLLIEIIMHQHLVYAVRGASVLNDATLHDASQVNMEGVADVITNGSNAASTLLSECSSEFLEQYHTADVIISKGQGNLEGLIDTRDPRIYFLLMVKCDVIAEKLGVEKGDFVVYNFSEQDK